MKTKKKQWKMLFLLSLVLTCVLGLNASADSGITIDGSFYDWENISHADIQADNSYYSRVAVKMDDEYLYLHFVEQQYNQWWSYINSTYVNFTTQDGTSNALQFGIQQTDGKLTKLVVRLRNGYVEVTSAEAYHYGVNGLSGLGEWEAKIPLKNIGKITSVSVDLGNGIVYEPTAEDMKLDQVTESGDDGEAYIPDTEETEDSDSASGETGEAASTIQIDGYFDDWADKMHYLVINWSMPQNQRNVYNCRQFSALYDDENIYFHVVMRKEGNEEFQSNEYHMEANGKEVIFVLRDKDNKNITFPNGNRTARIQEVGVYYRQGQAAGFSDLTPIENSKAYLVVKEGQPDEVEFSIPVSAFETVYGTPVGDFTELTVWNPNLMENQKLVIAGTSTAPWVIAGIGAAIAVGGFVLDSRKKKKAQLGES
jgi:uncharacterized protein (TIGR04145 family)